MQSAHAHQARGPELAALEPRPLDERSQAGALLGRCGLGELEQGRPRGMLPPEGRDELAGEIVGRANGHGAQA